MPEFFYIILKKSHQNEGNSEQNIIFSFLQLVSCTISIISFSVFHASEIKNLNLIFIVAHRPLGFKDSTWPHKN